MLLQGFIKHLIQKKNDGAFDNIIGNTQKYGLMAKFRYALYASRWFMVNNHVEQMQRLQTIQLNFGFRFFDAINQVRLESEFFSKHLHHHTAFGVVGGFKYYSPGLMKHE